MPKTFELKFNKIAENLYSGSLLVEGRQMAFGVPKTKEEIYQFLFAVNPGATASDPEEIPAIQQTSTDQPAPEGAPEFIQTSLPPHQED